MFIDALATLSDAQALTSTGYSTNTYDTGLASNGLGLGTPLCVVVTVDVAADTGSSDETYQFSLVQSANADLSSHDVLLTTDTTLVSRSTLVQGYKLVIPFPPGLISKRYIGARYTLGGTTPSITVTAEIQPLAMVQNEKAYPKGYTIS